MVLNTLKFQEGFITKLVEGTFNTSYEIPILEKIHQKVVFFKLKVSSFSKINLNNSFKILRMQCSSRISFNFIHNFDSKLLFSILFMCVLCIISVIVIGRIIRIKYDRLYYCVCVVLQGRSQRFVLLELGRNITTTKLIREKKSRNLYVIFSCC